MTLERRLEQLNEYWPDLTWKEARLEDCDHDVVLLDEDWVFRFACKVRDHEPLELEIPFLERVRDEIDLPVPRYTHVAPGLEVAGYRRIPGESLSVRLDEWEKLDRSAQEKAAADLAQLLNVVHGFPVEVFRAMGGIRGKRLWPSWRKRFRRQPLVPDGILTRPESDYLEQQVRAFQSLPRRALYQDFVVLQGDMDLEHILLDDRGVSGVIDWGDVTIGDPAVDLIQLWGLGEPFVDQVLAHYNFASDGVKQRSRWMFMGIAIRALSRAGVGPHKDRYTWRRGYRIFPESIADPSRADGYW